MKNASGYPRVPAAPRSGRRNSIGSDSRTFVLCAVVLGTALAPGAFSGVIDFETLTGPSTFVAAGNVQSVNISTGIGTVNVQGGVILTAATNLPADETSIYGTAGNAADNIGVPVGTGLTNPITITFPVGINNFFLDVLNGNLQNVNYQVADNNGHSANFVLVPNLSSGQTTIGFAAIGTVVTIAATTGQSTPSGMTWDFFIDNIHFNEALPPSLGGPGVPEPATMLTMSAGMAVLLLVGLRARSAAKAHSA